MPQYTYSCEPCGVSLTLTQERSKRLAPTCGCGKLCRQVLRPVQGALESTVQDDMNCPRPNRGDTYAHIKDENGNPYVYKYSDNASQLQELKEAAEAQLRRNNPNRKKPIEMEYQDNRGLGLVSSIKG
jgi:hypothetical protein